VSLEVSLEVFLEGTGWQVDGSGNTSGSFDYSAELTGFECVCFDGVDVGLPIVASSHQHIAVAISQPLNRAAVRLPVAFPHKPDPLVDGHHMADRDRGC